MVGEQLLAGSVVVPAGIVTVDGSGQVEVDPGTVIVSVDATQETELWEDTEGQLVAGRVVTCPGRVMVAPGTVIVFVDATQEV